MAASLHPEPTDAQLAAIRSHRPDRPIVCLNLNRYRERAAYLRYGVVAVQAIASVGGRILWATEARALAIGCDHDRYEEVVAVWYPSRAAFLRLEEFPGYTDALWLHRRAAIEHASLLVCDAAAEPVLTSPWG